MNSLRPFLIFILLLFFPTAGQALHKGIALGLYSKDVLYTYEKEILEIKATGADHISLVVSWYQKDIRGNEIYPRPLTSRTPASDDNVTTPDSQLTTVIDRAHRLGLKVFLFPILRIEHRTGRDWRGDLKPVDLEAWWKSYRNFILTYAKLAAAHGVEIYSVGSELCAMEPLTLKWRQLIREVRDLYRGKLLYSANWDHYRKIDFWRDLDFLGLNGYYKLATHAGPTLGELIEEWSAIRKKLTSWQDLYNRPIVLTELGYPSMEGTSQAPWDYSRDAPVNLEEQALCYEAFFRVWGHDSRLGGVYFWNWFGEGGPQDRGYTPRHKPAEEVLSQWFQKLLPSGKWPSSSSVSTSLGAGAPNGGRPKSQPVPNRS